MAPDRVIQKLREISPQAEAISGFESAVRGICYRSGFPPLVAYDISKCVDILCDRGVPCDEARDYLFEHIVSAWNGVYTPVFLDI